MLEVLRNEEGSAIDTAIHLVMMVLFLAIIYSFARINYNRLYRQPSIHGTSSSTSVVAGYKVGTK